MANTMTNKDDFLIFFWGGGGGGWYAYGIIFKSRRLAWFRLAKKSAWNHCLNNDSDSQVGRYLQYRAGSRSKCQGFYSPDLLSRRRGRIISVLGADVSQWYKLRFLHLLTSIQDRDANLVDSWIANSVSLQYLRTWKRHFSDLARSAT
jgi:hypothetical protein